MKTQDEKYPVQDVVNDKKFAEHLEQVSKNKPEKSFNFLQSVASFMAGLEIGTKFKEIGECK